MVSAQVASPVFYHKGESEFSGATIGVNIDEADRLYDIQSTMVAGNLHDLNTTTNGVIIGVGVAEKLSVKVGDNISLTSPKNVPKVLRVVGLFKTANAAVDKSRSYMNIATAQQILLKGPEYVSDINIKIKNHELAPKYAAKFSVMTGYKAEDWQAANATFVSASKMRAVILGTISFTVLIVAAFGIYNILSMTISQKMNDIAILKAMGFKGRDVTRIFVQQALIIGAIGVLFGLLLATLLIYRMSKVYLGGDIGYFPIQFEWTVYLRGAIIGILVTFFAGLIPARKAANVDPVSILRK
jgi:lipoprotein-releasing system permease protein